MSLVVVDKPTKGCQIRLNFLIVSISLSLFLAGGIGCYYAWLNCLSLPHSWETLLALVGAVGSIATFVSLLIALRQIVLVGRQALDAAETSRQTKAAVDTVLQNVRQDVRFHVAGEAIHYFEMAHARIRTARSQNSKLDWNEAIIRFGDVVRQLQSLEPLEETAFDREVWAVLARDMDDLCRSFQPLLTNYRKKLTGAQEETLDRVSQEFWNKIKKYKRNIVTNDYEP